MRARCLARARVVAVVRDKAAGRGWLSVCSARDLVRSDLCKGEMKFTAAAVNKIHDLRVRLAVSTAQGTPAPTAVESGPWLTSLRTYA